MKVSVIIPVFNEEKYIEQCIKSLMEQEVLADEIIIVDNNSTDDTVKIASQFPVKIIQEKKQGMIFARNAGFNKGIGDILARCDADSILPPYWIKVIKKHFTDETVDAVSGPIQWYDFLKGSVLWSKTFNMIFEKTQGFPPLNGPNMAISKKIWDRVKNKVCLDDKQVHEDLSLAITISEEGGKIINDNALIAYVSSRRLKEKPDSFLIEYPIRIIKTFKYHQTL